MIRLPIALLLAITLTTLTPKTLIDPPLPPEPVIQQEIEQPQRDDAKTIACEVSAYCLRGKTAAGTTPGPGTISVDPNVIPLGSRLWVEGYGEGWAVDTGSAIKGYTLDVWFADRETCMQWGRRRNVEVRILEVRDERMD